MYFCFYFKSLSSLKKNTYKTKRKLDQKVFFVLKKKFEGERRKNSSKIPIKIGNFTNTFNQIYIFLTTYSFMYIKNPNQNTNAFNIYI